MIPSLNKKYVKVLLGNVNPIRSSINKRKRTCFRRRTNNSNIASQCSQNIFCLNFSDKETSLLTLFTFEPLFSFLWLFSQYFDHCALQRSSEVRRLTNLQGILNRILIVLIKLNISFRSYLVLLGYWFPCFHWVQVRTDQSVTELTINMSPNS